MPTYFIADPLADAHSLNSRMFVCWHVSYFSRGMHPLHACSFSPHYMHPPSLLTTMPPPLLVFDVSCFYDASVFYSYMLRFCSSASQVLFCVPFYCLFVYAYAFKSMITGVPWCWVLEGHPITAQHSYAFRVLNFREGEGCGGSTNKKIKPSYLRFQRCS